MSRPVDNLPPTARAIALLLASTPSVQDAQPGVLHQLLEFANRYTHQVLTDARVYAEHAGRQDKVDLDDVVLAVQARVGWEFGGRIPKEFILSLATQTNATPLPAVPEVFGVRLPPQSECLTSIDFDLVPNKPPPGQKLFEEIEEVEESESESEEDVDMEPAPIPIPAPEDATSSPAGHPMSQESPREEAPFPISAIAVPETQTQEDGSEAAEDDDLFDGGNDDASDGMEEVAAAITPTTTTNGVKRKLQEDDDYD